MIERNSILQGDCLELMNEIDDKSIDMILCDLPYGTTQNKWDAIIPFDLMWKQYERIIKNNGAIILTAAQPFTSTLIVSNLKLFKYCWVWDKKKVTGFLNSKRRPLVQHEDICVFYKEQCTYIPQMHSNKLKRNFEGSVQKPHSDNYGKQRNYVSTVKDDVSYPRSIIEQTGVVGNSKEKTDHPTQKPVALFEYLIKTYTNEGELVLDNTAGSMTTAIACINTNRDFIVMEKDPEYFTKGSERINNHIEDLLAKTA
jgi:site-specific DNA-methyltransferase (adenine-specific)